jgi:hypothetical protein
LQIVEQKLKIMLFILRFLWASHGWNVIKIVIELDSKYLPAGENGWLVRKNALIYE